MTDARAGEFPELIARYQWLVVVAVISSLGFVPSSVITFASLGLAHLTHATFAILWLLLLSLQFLWLRKRVFPYHRITGWISIPVFLGMVVSAAFLLWMTAPAAFAQGPVFRMVYWVDFVLLPASVVFYFLGIFYRKNLPLHAGFLSMTVVAMIPPGLGRLFYAVFLYPFSLPLSWFYFPTMAIVTLLLLQIGFDEKWRYAPVRWATAIFVLTFLSSYLVQSQVWLNDLVQVHFHSMATSAH
ncbi:hypothetical protein KUV22_16515 [Microbulbifer agarilyticus]|uniref:hypothetical protein n=1 Tax=Microbulbifer agarilyticus TaxID=260552 RepID=UPI001C98887D|nr:hypothetical protein [Microbulbifer agarilyticus]MBY6192030.1 hypothetical protein [Microbulbifer agarilyticus]